METPGPATVPVPWTESPADPEPELPPPAESLPAGEVVPSGLQTSLPSVVQAVTASAPDFPPLRVLVAHPDAAGLRRIREAFETVPHWEVRTTSSALTAFDRVLQEPFRLLLLDLHLAPFSGELLYDLIARAYPRLHPGTHTAPPVIWLGTPGDLSRRDELTREARAKGLFTTPFSLDRLLAAAATVLPRQPGPAGFMPRGD